MMNAMVKGHERIPMNRARGNHRYKWNRNQQWTGCFGKIRKTRDSSLHPFPLSARTDIKARRDAEHAIKGGRKIADSEQTKVICYHRLDPSK